jgi:hypothetical protein
MAASAQVADRQRYRSSRPDGGGSTTEPAAWFGERPDSATMPRSQELVPLLSYTATPRGLWFVAWPTETRTDWTLMVLRPGENTPRVIGPLGFPYTHLLNLSISRDERYALLTKPDPQGADLLLVKNFR